MLRIIFCLLILFSVCSCKKESNDFDMGYGYFGLKSGNFVDYEVMEIVHDQPSLIHDTVRYQLRTLIGDTIIDNEGAVANKFFRYKRQDETQDWQLMDVWTTIIRNNKGQIVEENQRRNKLHFPVRFGEKWDVNTFNMDGKLEYSYRNVNQKMTYHNETLDSTVMVFEQNYKTLIDHRVKYEIYAKGIGLVQKYYKDFYMLNFDTLSPRVGNEVFYNMIAHGNL